MTWYNAATNGSIVTPTQVGVGTSTYYAQAFDGTCNSLTRTAVTLTINAVPSVNGNNQTVCSDGTLTQTLTASATGGTITWYDAATGGNVVASPTQVGVGSVTYYAESSNGLCSSLTRAAVILTINPVPAAPVSGGDQTVCENGNPTQTLTASATGGTITWYNAATNGSVVTPTQVGVGTSTYYAEASDGTCPSLTRTAVTLTINAAPAAPTASNQTVCSDGTLTQTLTASATGGTITWYDAATGGNIVATPEQVGVGTVTYYAESFDGTCISLTRTAVTLTINPVPAAPISGGDQTVCENGNPTQTLTATATGGTITWYDAATNGNVVTPTQTGVGTSTYYAEASDGTCSSLTRTAVTLTINAAPAAPVSGGDQTACEDGNPTQTLTATATGGTITWYDAATGGNVVVSPTQVGVGTVTYYAESSDGTCNSLTRTAVSLTITAAPVAVASNQTVCSDGTLTQTLTATATATGGTITWYDAATGGNVVASPTQVGVGSATYYAEASDGTCISLSRAAVTLTINPVPAAPVSGGDQTVCEDGNPTQTLTATATGGTITWYDAATNGNVVTPTQVGVGTSTYYAEASDGTCSSLTRTAVTLTINAAPAAPTASNQTVCSDGTLTQTLTATATGGTITWYDAASGGNVVASPTQVGVGTVTYYAESSDGTCSSLTRTAVSLTINPVPAAPVSGGDQTVCEDGNPTQTLTASATGGTITWYDAATNGNVVTPAQVGVGTSTYYAESSDGTCSSLTRTAVTLTINAAPAAPTASNQTVCSDGTLTQTLTATATGGTITWYDAATNGNVVTPTQVGVGTSTYYAEASDGTCSSLTRTAVTLTINPVPAAPVSGGDQAVCSDGTLTQTLTATATGGTITWYDAATNGNVVTPTLVGVGSVTYYAESSDGTCSSLTRTAVTLTINPLPATASVTVTQPNCLTATGTITVNGPLGAGFTYNIGAGEQSSPIFAGLSANTYNVSVTNNFGCVSLVSATATVNPQPFVPGAPVVTGITNVCPYAGSGEQLTYTASVPGATSYNWILPPNVTLVSGTGTANLVVTIDATFSATQPNKQIRVTAISECGTSALTIFYLTSQYPSTPGVISGPTDVCALIGTANTATYTISKVTAATSYVWSTPGGTSVSHPNGPGINDTVIVITYNSNFASGQIKVSAFNACGTSGSVRSLQINRTPASTPGLISGPTNVCANIAPSGTAATYSILPIAGATSYNWTAPLNAVVTHPNGPGANDYTITVLFPAGFANGTISVTATNGCGTSGVRTLSITRLYPATPSVMDVIQTIVCPDRHYSYTVSSMPANATSLQWTIPAAGIIRSQSPTSITVEYPPTAVQGVVTVQAVNSCGSSTVRTQQVKLGVCAPERPAGNEFSKGNSKQPVTLVTAAATPETMDVKVYPNPTVSDFNLQVITAGKETIHIRILDMQGRAIRELTVMPYQKISIGADLKAGSYMIETRQGKDVKTVKVIKF
ncbi:MAG: T9SS type A sorting domain-containing protein [Ferruginibacter sp.]